MSAYDRLNKADRLYARRARRAGVPEGWSSLVIEQAVKAGIPRSRALALIQTESGFQNVFGHDPGLYHGAGLVTEQKYRDYKRLRGHNRMQGVGPAQLTWWEFQDAADLRGGAWKPEHNMRVAFDHLKRMTKRYGTRDGIRRYNGGGGAAVHYAETVQRRERQWKKVLLGLSRKAPA